MSYFHLNEEFKKSLYHFNLSRRKKRLFLIAKVFLVFFALGFFISSLLVSQMLSRKTTLDLSAFLPSRPQISLSKLPSEIKNEEPWNLPSLKKDSQERSNILFLGIPGKLWPGARLTDSIMVISLNARHKKILVLSIPRDLLVRIPKSNWETKINALLLIDQEGRLIQEIISEITGLEIHYFSILELASLEKIVDALGGIEVEVKKDIYDPRFPTPDRGYETFSLKAGLQKLDGKTATKYIRTRYEARGDFARIERQHQVIQAIFNKTKDLELFKDFESIFKIFQEIKGEEKTNLGIFQLRDLASLSKIINPKEIEYFTLDTEGEEALLAFGKTILGGNLASILWPKEGKFEYSKIREKILKLTTTP